MVVPVCDGCMSSGGACRQGLQAKMASHHTAPLDGPSDNTHALTHARTHARSTSSSTATLPKPTLAQWPTHYVHEHELVACDRTRKGAHAALVHAAFETAVPLLYLPLPTFCYSGVG